MLVMQEDPDGEHQENVLATGMVANSRPQPRGRQTEAALLVSASIALCESQPEKSEATSDDEADPTHPHRYRAGSRCASRAGDVGARRQARALGNSCPCSSFAATCRRNPALVLADVYQPT